MTEIISFVTKSALLGLALAMDAFSVSLANGLSDTDMKRGKLVTIASVFAGFQFLMPLIGWLCVHSLASAFTAFQKFIPWIAMALLGFIGGKMLVEGIKQKPEEQECGAVCIGALLVQGVATSIDALSVGFTISDYDFPAALCSCLIIGVLTFFICAAGVLIGKKFGTAISGKATVLGGVILILIGIEIFVSGIIGA